MKLLRFARFCFQLVSSMFHLEAAIDHHLTNYSKKKPIISQEILDKTRSSLYADKLSARANRLEDA